MGSIAKLACCICSILLVPGYLVAQSKFTVKDVLTEAQISELKPVTDSYWKWASQRDREKKIRNMAQEVESLESIGKRDVNNWVVWYWASLIYTQLANSSTRKGVFLDRSQAYLDKSEKVFSYRPVEGAKPYFCALQSLIYGLKASNFSLLDDPKNAARFRDRSIEVLETGIRVDSDNPILMGYAAWQNLKKFQTLDLSQKLATKALLERSLEEFKRIPSKHSTDITYWSERWVASWLEAYRQNWLEPQQKR